MANIKLKINNNEEVTLMLPDEELLQVMHSDTSILLNVAQQFVEYEVDSVELLQGDEESTNSNVTILQPSQQLRENPNEERDEKRIWADKNVELLIQLYQKYEEQMNNGIKKQIWNKIANALSEVVGVCITSVQCDTKWKGLLRHYKIIKKHNDTSGNDHKYWKFYTLMDEILHKKPEITPVAVCSSSRGLQENESSDSSRTSTPRSNRSSIHKRTAENSIERRHTEKIQRQDRFLNILESIANNITKNTCNNCGQKSSD